MSLRKEIEGLNVQEKKVLLTLQELGSSADVKEVEQRTGFDHSAVMRATMSLEQRGLIKTSKKSWNMASLTDEGKNYIHKGLPERRMLEAIFEHGSDKIEAIRKRAGLDKELADISIGWLKRKGWAEFVRKEGETILKLTKTGEDVLDHKKADEQLLEKLSGVSSIIVDEFAPHLRSTVGELKKRNLIKLRKETQRFLSITSKGQEALEVGIEVKEEISHLTSDLLISGKWREAELRPYNVTAPGSPIYPGKEHPQQQVIEELRSILLQMGFKEIKGPLVESEFWNFDVLFQAQDHPAREVHDSLSLSVPSRAKIPDEKLLKLVKKAHEEGVANSTGWKYEFDEEISHKPMMCSQTTAATIRYLARNPKPPIKVFVIEKTFRRDRIDYKHLAEFPQAEGIVMAPGLTFQDMLGYLKQVLVEMGIPKVRFRPGYFPFTEPSTEAEGYFPERKEWIELLGAGMFRPEVLRPIGVKHPVLAWGMGFSRIAMIRMGIEDMRDLHNNDLERLKKRPLV